MKMPQKWINCHTTLLGYKKDSASFVKKWGNKAILHPPFRNNAVNHIFSNIQKVLPDGIEIPPGYVCYNHDDLQQAYISLRKQGYHSLIVKPICKTPVRCAIQLRNISEITIYDFKNGPCVIERRLLADINSMGKNLNCVVHFTGCEILGDVMHQELASLGYECNLSPSQTSHKFQQDLLRASSILLNRLKEKGLQGPGSLEFIPEHKKPFLIDVNVGKITPGHPAKEFHLRYATDMKFMSWEITPKSKSMAKFWHSLVDAGIAFDPNNPKPGVFPLCYIQDKWGMLIAFGKDIPYLENLKYKAIELL